MSLINILRMLVSRLKSTITQQVASRIGQYSLVRIDNPNIYVIGYVIYVIRINEAESDNIKPISLVRKTVTRNTSLYIHVYICMYVYIYIYIYVYTHMCISLSLYIYI